MRLLLPVMAAVCALTGLGALTAPIHAASPKQAAPSKELKALTDAEIERNIKERFSKSKIAANNFRVKVTGGVATIEGKTEIVQHKGVATRLAKLGGARSVNNRIEVSEAAKTKAAANLAEGRRRAQTHRAAPRSEARTAEPPAAPRTSRTTPPPAQAPQNLTPSKASNPAASGTPPGPRRAVIHWQNK